MTFPPVMQIEEAGLNAWPAPYQVLYDGWLLRFAGGFSKRVNSVNFLSPSKMPIEEKFGYCEAAYSRMGLPVIYRLVEPLSPPGLVEALEAAGYYSYDPTLVLGCPLREPGEASKEGLLKEVSLDEWVEIRVNLSGTPIAEWDIYRQILAFIVPEKTLLVLYHDDQPAACGMGVVERSLLGFFSIYTTQDFRRQGYGKQVMGALTRWGLAKGAQYGYLQVEADNLPALVMYEALGFERCYQYRYYRRMKE